MAFAGLLATGTGVAWLLLRKEKKVPELPIGIGDEEAQKRFLKQNAVFLKECTKLYALLEKVFIRSLVSARAENQVESIGEGIELAEAEQTAVRNRRMAEVVVFYLGRAAADDFGELMILAGNGRGFGAYKILRGMYERIVTAAFIAKYPSEAPSFLSYSYGTLAVVLCLTSALACLMRRFRDCVHGLAYLSL